MAETTARRVRTILDFLIDEDYLASEGDEYPVVVLGRAYGEIEEGQRLFMKLPKEQKRQVQAPEENLWRQAPAVNRRPAPAKTPGVPAGIPAGFPSFDNFDKALFEKLKELRKEIAAREGVPAYIVFNDASLRDMCRKKPTTTAQFSSVNGVGSVKLEKYGEAFIALMSKK
jgi:ATP-dependent DNA helicase RecQ